MCFSYQFARFYEFPMGCVLHYPIQLVLTNVLYQIREEKIRTLYLRPNNHLRSQDRLYVSTQKAQKQGVLAPLSAQKSRSVWLSKGRECDWDGSKCCVSICRGVLRVVMPPPYVDVTWKTSYPGPKVGSCFL